jgi:MYXO-CTERM domain-containing protein
LFGAFGSKTAFDEDFMLLGASGYTRIDSDGLAIVPEPSTYMLALLGLVALGAIRRRNSS